MSTIKQQIQQWKNGLFAPNQNDVLLTLVEEKNAINVTEVYQEENSFSIPENNLLKRIFSAHEQSIKETGSPIFGITSTIISFTFEEKEYVMPLLLASADIHKNRFNSTFKIQQIEDFYINPLLSLTLGFESLPENIESTLNKLKENGLSFSIKEGFWMANFHPHRFVLQKEFDELLEFDNYNESLKSLFGEESESHDLQLSDNFLFPADDSQRNAISLVKEQNVVIQGPPGTGKSQVIANLIGKILGVQQSVLLVAEKAVALQVIYDQLRKKNLHHFAVLYHHELKAKQFVQSLKSTWNFIEQLALKPIVLTHQTESQTQGLDLTLSRLKQKDLIGGIDFISFKNNFKEEKDCKYVSQKPSIKEWEENQVVLEDLQEKGFNVFGDWLSLKLDRHSIQEIEEKLKQCISLIKNNKLTELTLLELDRNLKLSGLISLFFHDDKPLSVDLFKENSKKQKQFLKLFKEYKTAIEKEEVLKEEEKHWNKNFSLSELEEFTKALASTDKFNIRNRLTRNKLLKFTDLNLLDGKKALENLMELKKAQREIVEIRSKLRKADISEDLPVLEHIHFTILKLQSADENDVKALFEYSEKEQKKLKNNAQVFNEIHHYIQYYFELNHNQPILEQLNNLKKVIPTVVEYSSLLKGIDFSTKSVLRESDSVEKANQIIYNSHWKDFKGRFPTLAEIDGKEIQNRTENIINSFDSESDEFSLFIQQEIKKKFEEYHVLLQTPARKLSQEEKDFKKKLRVGKSILVKAFDRKRVFPSVRELLNSEAKYWIQLLHPVFLCSPYSVAKSLPLNFTFDLGIFDEASQIPISHVVGSVQRSRRVVICGDQQQMAPQFYFQKKDNHQSDALHHASYYWQNVMLTHHYRSKYPELIEFSNRYFYENRLKTFPTFGKPEQVIEVIQVDGQFIDRKNEKEAVIVAEIISRKIKNKEFDFGLVAFSQTQLQVVLDKIPAKELNQLEDKDSIFIQSLENVQGDQCEHLIISLGYAPNEEGDFHKRFGPLNQEQGHRRLNVLMSRAISKITFIRSVTSEDFSISDNDGVELLRKLMIFLEEKSTIEYQQETKDSIDIQKLGTSFETAQSLVDYYRTLKDRTGLIPIIL